MIVGGVALEAAALYYQHALNQYPCMLCIHVRLWVLAFIVVGALGLLLKGTRPGLLAANVLSVMAAVGLAERSWETFATERGFSSGFGCSMDAGLPAWFALDDWFPALFQVQGPCGRTPTVFMNVTMAEALVAISAVALVVTALVTLASVLVFKPRRWAST